MEGEGLTARAFCHEIEHLDGHLFVEHIDHFLSDEELRDYLEQEERQAREAAAQAEEAAPGEGGAEITEIHGGPQEHDSEES